MKLKKKVGKIALISMFKKIILQWNDIKVLNFCTKNTQAYNLNII